MSDDVLLKYWRFAKEFDFDRVGESFIGLKANGFEESLYENYTCPYEFRKDGSKWGWWHREFGYTALASVWNSFINTLTRDFSSDNDRVRLFLKSLDGHADNKTSLIKFCVFGSDVFYVPRAKFDDFGYFSEIFRRNGVFLELATSSVLAGLDNDGRTIQKIDGEYHWHHPYNMGMYERIVQ